MTTQSQAPPPELVLVDPSRRAGATAVVVVPEEEASAPDPVETDPVETMPVETMPVETGPVETMPVQQRVQTVAGLAARGTAGVHALGDGSGSSGVEVDVGERQTAIEVSLVLDYGASVIAVSRTVRRTVIQAVEQDTGLEVTQVDVDVTDVHLPGGRPVGSLGGWPE